MIDHEARRIAAGLVREFGDGRLENDAFHAGMAKLVRSEDRALRAIESMVWRTSDDSRFHRLVGVDALNDEGHALFDRCVLFLNSDLEYIWPQDRFDRTTGYVLLAHILSLGLTWIHSRWLTRKNERFYAEVHASGDFDVWPFIDSNDYGARLHHHHGT